MKVIAFPTITALFVAGSGQAAACTYQPCSWEKQIVAACLVLEAPDQDEKGMRGGASVIPNRADRNYSAIMRVLKKPFAFSALNTDTTGRRDSLATHKRPRTTACGDPCCKSLTISVLQKWRDVTQGANHYVVANIRPSWAKSMAKTNTIGSHDFYTTYH